MCASSADRGPVLTSVISLSHFPSISSFFFASAFMFFTVVSWLADPVVCVRVAGGALLGTEVCCGCSLAGRVAVDLAVSLGGDASSADAIEAGANRDKAITASAADFILHLPDAGGESRLYFKR